MSPDENKGRPGEKATSAGEKNNGKAIVGDNPGLDRAIANADSWWWQGAWRVLLELAAAGRGFTVDDVRDRVGEPADPHHLGALMAAAYRLKKIQPVGAQVAADGRLVRVWWPVR